MDPVYRSVQVERGALRTVDEQVAFLGQDGITGGADA